MGVVVAMSKKTEYYQFYIGLGDGCQCGVLLWLDWLMRLPMPLVVVDVGLNQGWLLHLAALDNELHPVHWCAFHLEKKSDALASA